MTRTPFGWWFHIAGAPTREAAQARLNAALADGVRHEELVAFQAEHHIDYPDPQRPRAIIRVQTGATP